MRTWRTAADWLTEFLWPEPALCPGCGRPDRSPGRGCGFCRACLERLPRVEAPLCARCGKPLRLAGTVGDECSDCRSRERRFRIARAAGLYDGELRRLIHRFKFRRERRLAEPLARLLLSVWRRQGELQECAAVVPVPLSPDRLAERGFNQAEDLAGVLGRLVGRPMVVDALARRPGGGAQSLRPEKGRWGVRDRVFYPFRPGRVAGRKVLLVDDVLTTGSTAEACAEVLLRAGAVSVDVLTVGTTVVHTQWDSLRLPGSRKSEEE